MSPKLRSLLARVTLVGGVALVGTYMARHAPHDQTIAVRLGSRAVRHLEGVVTLRGEDEATVGFSQDFPGDSPRVVRHTFSAPNGTYIVVISLQERGADGGFDGVGDPSNNQDKEHPALAGDAGPNRIETSFERQVSLAGGEVIVSPD